MHNKLRSSNSNTDLDISIGTVHEYTAKEVIIVAGNFSLDGEIVNIAQYEMTTEM